jgi:guanylate kinase
MNNAAYTPAPHALDHLKQVDFVAVIGPTAAGKTTLIREGMRREPRLHLVLNNTSRARRPDEQEGVDYRFETREHMEARMARGEYAQVAPSVFGDLYATAAEDYATDGIALLPVLAKAMPVFRALPFKSIRSIFILPPDWGVWHQRMASRHFMPDQLEKRLTEARESLEFALEDTQISFVISGGVSRAVDDFVTLALGNPLPLALREDQHKALPIVRNLIKLLKDAKRGPVTP